MKKKDLPDKNISGRRVTEEDLTSRVNRDKPQQLAAA